MGTIWRRPQWERSNLLEVLRTDQRREDPEEVSIPGTGGHGKPPMPWRILGSQAVLVFSKRDLKPVSPGSTSGARRQGHGAWGCGSGGALGSCRAMEPGTGGKGRRRAERRKDLASGQPWRIFNDRTMAPAAPVDMTKWTPEILWILLSRLLYPRSSTRMRGSAARDGSGVTILSQSARNFPYFQTGSSVSQETPPPRANQDVLPPSDSAELCSWRWGKNLAHIRAKCNPDGKH